MAVGTLEEIIDDNHAIVSTSVGSEHYVTIMSFVDKDQLEPGCTVLLNHKVHVFILFDSTRECVLRICQGSCRHRCSRRRC
jgi:ATP-dependent 26S proteasome regulatory subunit